MPRPITLDHVETVKEVRSRHGDDAADALPAGVLGVEQQTLWWLERDRPLRHMGGAALFWLKRAWIELGGLHAFRQLLADSLPELRDVDGLTQAYAHLVQCEILWTRDEVDDYGDSRFHVFTKHLDAWEPPTFDGKVLAFFVEDHGAFQRVRIDQETLAVDVVKAG